MGYLPLPRYAGCVVAGALMALAAPAAFGQDSYPSQVIHIYTSEAGSTPEDFSARVKADFDRWRKVIKDTGIRVE